MKKLSTLELERPQLSEIGSIRRIPIVIVLDNVRSGLNVGSIFRTADAFAIEKVILTGITQTPPHREILKTALGSTDSVSWEFDYSGTEALSALKRDDYLLVAVEQTNESIPLNSFKFEKDQKYALILGNEVEGISESVLELVDMAVEIPQSGIKHSLNVSVCGGIIMWEAVRQFSEK